MFEQIIAISCYKHDKELEMCIDSRAKFHFKISKISSRTTRPLEAMDVQIPASSAMPEIVQHSAPTMMDLETEFLASKEETGNEWELFKENVRPLKRGRNVKLLNQSLKSNSDIQVKDSLLDTRRKLIRSIDEYEGEDPLHPWLEFIKWVQDAFPPGGDCSGLVVIYEQCVRSFWHEDRYKDDLGYLKVWLEYAENCADAEVVYKFLNTNRISLTIHNSYISRETKFFIHILVIHCVLDE